MKEEYVHLVLILHGLGFFAGGSLDPKPRIVCFNPKLRNIRKNY